MADLSHLPTVVVPAAGSSKRFTDVGITTPKGLIRIQRNAEIKTMIEHIVPPLCSPIVVSQNPDYAHFNRFFRIHQSHGQTDSLYQWANSAPDQPFIAMNNDVLIHYPLPTFYRQVAWAEAAVLVFNGHRNTAFSYVDNVPYFEGAREKFPISDWAIAGAFYFKSSKRFAEAAYRQMLKPTRSEFYVSGVYQHLNGPKLAVIMPEDYFCNWGTPEDLARDRGIRVEDPAIEAILATYR